jgi:hypothetical protein
LGIVCSSAIADFAGRCVHAPLHAGHVAAGAEALAVAGEDERADLRVAGNLFERGDEIAAHRIADGIALLGAVEREDGDAGLDLQLDLGGYGGVHEGLFNRL